MNINTDGELHQQELENNSDIAAMEALEFARSLPHGLPRTEALKQDYFPTGQLGIIAFTKKGRPRKGWLAATGDCLRSPVA